MLAESHYHCNLVRFSQELLVDGKFTAESLKKFLVSAYNERKITDPAFAVGDCLVVKDLTGQGGVLTGQLFLVKSFQGQTEREFIVKELIAGENEISDLIQVAHYQPVHPYIWPKSVKDFPIIYLPIAYLYYSADDKDYYFSLMPKAQGQEFFNLMNSYVANPCQEHTMHLHKAYAALGRTLAHFHSHFMQPDNHSLKGLTITHGDLHARNIFYDLENDTISWIDNQSMRASIHERQSLFVDMHEALCKHLHDYDWLGFDKNIRDNPQSWIDSFYPGFFDNYLREYGPEKKKHAQELQEILLSIEDERLRNLCISAINFD